MPHIAPQAYGFAEFYADYPRKKHRLDAEKAWAQALRREPNLPALCQEALPWQKLSPEWVKDDGQFIPYPATYLRQGGFYDEDPAVEQKRQAEAAREQARRDAQRRSALPDLATERERRRGLA